MGLEYFFAIALHFLLGGGLHVLSRGRSVDFWDSTVYCIKRRCVLFFSSVKGCPIVSC